MATRKRRDPDYQLNVFSSYDEETRKEVTVFLVQTAKIFTSFQYDIILEHSIDGRLITISILGLYVPEILLPHTGPARGRIAISGLDGAYTIRVVKQDKSVNEFQIELQSGNVTTRKKPTDGFILLSAEPVEID